MDVNSRNRVSLKSDFSTLAPPSWVSDATNQPGLVRASRVAGVFSAPAEKAGAYTSKRTGSSDEKFSTSAVRRGSGASEIESSFVGKRVSISIVLDLQGVSMI